MGKKKDSKYVSLSLSKTTRTMSSAKEYTIQLQAPVKFDKLLIRAIASLEQLEEYDNEKKPTIVER